MVSDPVSQKEKGQQKARTWIVPRRTFFLSLLLLTVVTVSFAWLLKVYYQSIPQAEEVAELRAQTRELFEENQRLQGALSDLRQDVQALSVRSDHLRQLLDMSDDDPVVAAVGGFAAEADSGPDDPLQAEIDQLHLQIELEGLKQLEISRFLEEQQSLEAGKPQGWPVQGWVTSGFGRRYSPFTGRRVMHEGIDIAANKGTPVYATAAGVVRQVANHPEYGKVVEVDHGYGLRTFYAHNARIYVSVGQRVARGDRLAAVGSTGRATGPHLHYEVRLRGKAVNPYPYF